MCDGHDGRCFFVVVFFLLTVVSFPDGIKVEFLRQLRLPAAPSPLQREKKKKKKGEQLFGDEGMAK